jgi:outer membrane biosynthesis protein TonB
MTAWSYRRRDSLTPALLAALGLHVALFLILIITPRSSLIPTGTAVPINIVANGPTTDSRPAVQAPLEQQAQVEAPVPQAKPPEPAPAPPQPKPVVKPTPAKLAKPTKDTFDLAAIQADVGARPKSLNLAALQSEMARESRAHPSHPAFAQRGPTQAETAREARVDAGTGVSQSDLAGLSQLLERLWNPDCANGQRPVIPVKFTIGFDGHLQGPVDTAGRDIRSDIDARRAVDAVHQAAPFADTYRGLTVTVRFDAKKACAQHD